jgi:hypothetical protein
MLKLNKIWIQVVLLHKHPCKARGILPVPWQIKICLSRRLFFFTIVPTPKAFEFIKVECWFIVEKFGNMCKCADDTKFSGARKRSNKDTDNFRHGMTG